MSEWCSCYNEYGKKDRYSHVRDTYHVHAICDHRVELVGGGDFYSGEYTEPNDETREEAEKLAKEFGKRITSAQGRWEGWSEYTPDPGDVSVFTWEDDA